MSTTKVEYSHLPLDGICVGLTTRESEGSNYLVIAAAFTHERDLYSRSKARSIVNQRLNEEYFNRISDDEVFAQWYVLDPKESFDIRKFTTEFRKRYKPLPTQTRKHFGTLRREEAWQEICLYTEVSLQSYLRK